MPNDATIPNGPVLRARITSATKAVTDFTTETDDWISGKSEQPAWQSWAWGLHTQLSSLLAAIGETR